MACDYLAPLLLKEGKFTVFIIISYICPIPLNKADIFIGFIGISRQLIENIIAVSRTLYSFDEHIWNKTDPRI